MTEDEAEFIEFMELQRRRPQPNLTPAQAIAHTETWDAANGVMDALAQAAHEESDPERKKRLEEITQQALQVVLKIQHLGRLN